MRTGVRILRKHPRFAIVAALTLALGVGATATIFSVVDAVLLRPLPDAAADRLVMVWENVNLPQDKNAQNAPRFIAGVPDRVPALGFDGLLDFAASFGPIPAGVADDLVIATQRPPVERMFELIHGIKIARIMPPGKPGTDARDGCYQ